MTKGFTLIEITVSVAIFCIIISIITGLLLSVIRTPKIQLDSMDNINVVRGVSTNFINEIRSAVTGNDGSYPLSVTTPWEIIFYSSAGTTQNNINRIRYYVSDNTSCNNVVSNGSVLCKQVSTLSGFGSATFAVLAGLTNGTTPLFYYYDGDYNGTGNPLVTPVNTSKPRFIKINIIINGYSFNGGGAIRSLKDNSKN